MSSSVISQDTFWQRIRELVPHPVDRTKLDALLTTYGENNYRSQFFSVLCYAHTQNKLPRVMELMEEGAELPSEQRNQFFTKRIKQEELGLYSTNPGKGN